MKSEANRKNIPTILDILIDLNICMYKSIDSPYISILKKAYEELLEYVISISKKESEGVSVNRHYDFSIATTQYKLNDVRFVVLNNRLYILDDHNSFFLFSMYHEGLWEYYIPDNSLKE